jgi:hypothetical protein
LLFALRNDLQSLLATYEPRLKRIDVLAELSEAGERPCGKRVATGFSAGVDSFATLYRYTAGDVPANLRLTDLTVFNVGAFGHTNGESYGLYEHSRERCARYASTRGMGSLFATSNMDDFYGGVGVSPAFQKTHTLRNAAAALLFEREVALYYYSSAHPYCNIRATPSSAMGYLDPILLPLLSTERMSFVSAAAGLSRGEKTALLVDKEDAWTMLDVCVASPTTRLPLGSKNCSKCWKCARTMITLDALGELEKFASVFNLQYYKANRSRLFLLTIARSENDDAAAIEALGLARSRGLPMPSLPRRISFRMHALGRRTRNWAGRLLQATR